MVDRYLCQLSRDCLELAPTNTDLSSELSWVLSQYMSIWVELNWVELGWVASRRVGIDAFGFRLRLRDFEQSSVSERNSQT